MLNACALGTPNMRRITAVADRRWRGVAVTSQMRFVPKCIRVRRNAFGDLKSPNASRFVRNASRDKAKCIWGRDLTATNRRGCSKFLVAAALPLLIVSDELAANEISM
jgi:hypothetical protein